MTRPTPQTIPFARLHVVLVEPEIPPNTGNVARLCAATNSMLHLVEPLGFKLDDNQLKRAGMDYWKHVGWQKWASWSAFEAAMGPGARLWFIEQGGATRYTDAVFQAGDFLVFGRETAGLPKALLERFPTRCLRIPMFNPDARSLNLSNCVALAVYEAMRHQGFSGEIV